MSKSGSKKGHKYYRDTYMCKQPSHNSDKEGYHVLVCHTHKETPENDRLLNKFKDEVIKKFEEDLPPSSKNLKIVMHNQAHIAGVHEGAKLDEKGIFMLQNFNIFYDKGMICKNPLSTG